ncbi:MAG: IS1096 element passenger TnpR family protein [Draconibacterium sp.]
MEVTLDAKHSFFDFHTIIQKSVGFESHQLASFFVSENRWKKLVEISMLDLGINGAAFFIMQKTKLSDLLHTERQQLIYTFDFLNDRSFLIELTGIIMGKNLNEPFITLKQGEAPVQVLGEEVAHHEQLDLMQEEVYMDFGELDDYTEIFGEMDDF